MASQPQPKPRDALHFPPSSASQINPYTPASPARTSTSNPQSPSTSKKPHITLTFATSLDSNLSLAPGLQTALSGPLSKAMTHHLRSVHTAILIGVGTALADDPSLNCRIEGVGGYGSPGLDGQPRPIIVDPRGRWDVSETSKVIRLAKEGRGRAPWVLTCPGPWSQSEGRHAKPSYPEDGERRRVVESAGGKVVEVFPAAGEGGISWDCILSVLADEGIASVMIEGGGAVINALLSPRYFHLVDSVIVTVAPTWLGQGGVQVCPEARMDEKGGRIPVARLRDVKWVPLGDDVVLCGRPIL